jgi:hypothetical protein
MGKTERAEADVSRIAVDKSYSALHREAVAVSMRHCLKLALHFPSVKRFPPKPCPWKRISTSEDVCVRSVL